MQLSYNTGMNNTEKSKLCRFRKKHKLSRIWLPKDDIASITDMYLSMRKGELDKELEKYLRNQKKEK